jgi:ABC-2 type transport system ATP-binding protein
MVDRHVIEVKNLVKRYKGAKENAVDKVSFYAEEGSFFSLLGPNGAGKTTIISILTTTLSKTEGVAEILGHDIDKEESLVRKNIGVIFQKPSLDLNLTAEENIRFHANLYGLYKYMPSYSLMPLKYRDEVQRLSKILGMQDDIFRPVKNLSGGMKRKLEIIRSLMHSPKVLFLDEPTTGLDPISRKNLWNYLQEVRKKEKTTIFLTTHYIEEAEAADYICIINHGKIIDKGTPQEIKDRLLERSIMMDSEDRESLKKELSEKNMEYTGSGPFVISFGDRTSQEIIHGINTPLTVLDINNPSLEEAYIKIIENE